MPFTVAFSFRSLSNGMAIPTESDTISRKNPSWYDKIPIYLTKRRF